MEVNDKKLNRTRTIINWLIAIALGVFLIMLSNAIIRDLYKAVDEPRREQFSDRVQGDKLREKMSVVQNATNALQETEANILKMIKIAETNKEAEQQSFDNWIKTRLTLGNPKQDTEVLKRIAKLDELQAVVQAWSLQSDSVRRLINSEQSKEQLLNVENEKLEDVASDRYDVSIQKYNLHVFLVRLLFATPILALGIFFFIFYRRHKFSPLFMGFSLFSLYLFFVELVPYLPSYGGYVRATVGVLITLGLGYYAIKRLRNYAEQKKTELQASSHDRANNLQTDIAEKAFNNHVCPSCGKDFMLKNWEGLINTNLQLARPMISHYCRFCGLQLVKVCKSCKQPNYAHLPHCYNCGEGLK